jgi:hypothetical protein
MAKKVKLRPDTNRNAKFMLYVVTCEIPESEIAKKAA